MEIKQFLNREGTQDELAYYNKDEVLIYIFCKDDDNKEFVETTYDNFGNILHSRSSNGNWLQYTRCKETGKELTYENSAGVKRGFETKKEKVKPFLNREGTQDNLKYYNKEGVLIYVFCKYNNIFIEETYDIFGNALKSINSDGFWRKYARCKETGKELTYENSLGYKRGFKLKTPHLDNLMKQYKNIIESGTYGDVKGMKGAIKEFEALKHN